MEHKTSTETLIKALYVLANDIQSQDGVANAAILEAAQRMQEMLNLIRSKPKSKMNKKHVDVEYIESGTFVGGEEDCFNMEMEDTKKLVVISKDWYNYLLELSELGKNI